MKELFEILLNAYMNILQSQEYWKENLHRKYLVFSGNFHKVLNGESFKLCAYEGDDQLELQLAAPQTTKEVRDPVTSHNSFLVSTTCVH